MSLKLFTTDYPLQGSINIGLAFESSWGSSNGCFANQSSRTGRLVHHTDGTLEIISKTVAEVFGERVLKPLVDRSFHISSKFVSFLRNGLSSLNAGVLCLPVTMAESALSEKSELIRNIYAEGFVSLSSQADEINNEDGLLDNFNNITHMLIDLRTFVSQQKEMYGGKKIEILNRGLDANEIGQVREAKC